MKITKREMAVLEAINHYVEENKYAPTVREISDMIGSKSPSTTHGFLNRMRRKGILDWEPTRPRTLRILKCVI